VPARTAETSSGSGMARMAQRYFFESTVWFLVVTTLGAGCGDGESSGESERDPCGQRVGVPGSLCGNGVLNGSVLCGEE
jgi:hypothetical protein